MCAILLNLIDGSPEEVVEGLVKLSSHLVPPKMESENIQGTAAKVLGPVVLQFLRVVVRDDNGELESGSLKNHVALVEDLSPAVDLVGLYKATYMVINPPTTLKEYTTNVMKIVEALRRLPGDQKFGKTYRPFWIARMRNVAEMGQRFWKNPWQRGGLSPHIDSVGVSPASERLGVSPVNHLGVSPERLAPMALPSAANTLNCAGCEIKLLRETCPDETDWLDRILKLLRLNDDDLIAGLYKRAKISEDDIPPHLLTMATCLCGVRKFLHYFEKAERVAKFTLEHAEVLRSSMAAYTQLDENIYRIVPCPIVLLEFASKTLTLEVIPKASRVAELSQGHTDIVLALLRNLWPLYDGRLPGDMEFYRHVYGLVPQGLQDIVAQIKLPSLVSLFLAHLATAGLLIGAKRCAARVEEEEEKEDEEKPTIRIRLEGPCVFGCTVTKSAKNGKPYWRKLQIDFQGHPAGSTVCGLHFQRANKVKNRARAAQQRQMLQSPAEGQVAASARQEQVAASAATTTSGRSSGTRTVVASTARQQLPANVVVSTSNSSSGTRTVVASTARQQLPANVVVSTTEGAGSSCVTPMINVFDIGQMLRMSIEENGFIVLPNYIRKEYCVKACQTIDEHLTRTLVTMGYAQHSQNVPDALLNVPHSAWMKTPENWDGESWGIKKMLGYNRLLGGGRIFSSKSFRSKIYLSRVQHWLRGINEMLYQACCERMEEGAGVKLSGQTKGWKTHLDISRLGTYQNNTKNRGDKNHVCGK